jgi:hypothetical protein
LGLDKPIIISDCIWLKRNGVFLECRHPFYPFITRLPCNSCLLFHLVYLWFLFTWLILDFIITVMVIMLLDNTLNTWLPVIQGH